MMLKITEYLIYYIYYLIYYMYYLIYYRYYLIYYSFYLIYYMYYTFIDYQDADNVPALSKRPSPSVIRTLPPPLPEGQDIYDEAGVCLLFLSSFSQAWSTCWSQSKPLQTSVSFGLSLLFRHFMFARNNFNCLELQ